MEINVDDLVGDGIVTVNEVCIGALVVINVAELDGDGLVTVNGKSSGDLVGIDVDVVFAKVWSLVNGVISLQ